MTWRCVHASVSGTSHGSFPDTCQDAHRVELIAGPSSEPCLLIIVADGAGSAMFGGEGASLACDQACSTLVGRLGLAPLNGTLDEDDIHEALSAVRACLSRESVKRGIETRDLACTLIGVVILPHGAVYFQCGDGAIVVGNQGRYETVFWPDSGEFVNCTYFITDDDAFSHLHVRFVTTPPAEVAVFTDGLQHLALSYADKSVHAPFFAPMFSRLESVNVEECTGLNEALATFLDSRPVNERTDDDKTLVLAVRV